MSPALFPLAAQNVFLIGLAGALGTVRQIRLMDVAEDAQSPAVALDHSAFNPANAWPLAGRAGYHGRLGPTSTGRVGLPPTLCGLTVGAVALKIERDSSRPPVLVAAKQPRGQTMQLPFHLSPRTLLRPRRRNIAAVNAEVRDGIVPAGERIGQAADHTGGAQGANYRTVALIIACSMFMENLDATVLATALPTMARDFGVRAPEMSVSLTSYLLALAMFIPASGAVADRFGAKPVFRGAIALFVAGSLACGLSPTLETMVVARFVQGIGGAMMLPIGRLVLLRSVAKRDMVSAMSWLVMPAMIGPIVGPPLGGFIVEYLDWRWIFWLNLPIGAAGIVLVSRFVPDVRERDLHRFDWRGFLLSAVALGCLLSGFEAASRSGGLRPAALLVLVGAIAGAAYLAHARRTDYPILDTTLMRIPTFRLSLIGGSLARITQGAQPFLLPLMMQLAFGLSAAQSGAMTLATAIGSFGMKGVAPRLLRRFGFRSSLIVMGALGTAAYAICGLFRPGWTLPAVFAVMLVSGFLMSFQFTAYNTIAYDEVDKERMSAATSFYSTFQQLMLSLGICTGAVALHVSMLATGHLRPGFADFSAAFWTVTAISLCAVFVNFRFDRRAGAEMSAQDRSQA